MAGIGDEGRIMTAAPLCADCRHCHASITCTRPVESFWNPATNQRRSRLHVAVTFERSDRKFFGRTREKCGPQGWFWEPKVSVADVSIVPRHDTVADSDGDDGA
jgi:hypothetical protein